ncbi:hypothetical protein [Salimicrobium halophilum]|uniref:Uncharacterized protein n=1 Tax=Salimicrobium halophilum TaxID=86666 RepID=A0A1G8PR18_9BACI|nr:hypothetical protein [Salimicrobium halophilum]SDI94883.1 hypothetical protein SAMN04490247_0142 [Salimicrobium halophilum]
MAQDRKQIIVKEINYWKKSKLLPEKYCDFLLALYTEGEEKNSTFSVFKGRAGILAYYVLNFLMLPLSFVVIYFTENDIILQTVLLSVFVLLSCLQFWWIYKQDGWIHIPLSVSLLLILLLSMTVGSYYFANLYVFMISFVNALAWYMIGLRLKILYLRIISVVLIVGIILYMLF